VAGPPSFVAYVCGCIDIGMSRVTLDKMGHMQTPKSKDFEYSVM
jgi:hypothetical protein